MLIGISQAETIRYVSDLDPAKKKREVPIDPEKPELGTKEVEDIDWAAATVFALKPLDVFIHAAILDSAQSFTLGGQQNKVNGTQIEWVKYGCCGWQNFRDENGSEIKHETEKRFIGENEYTVTKPSLLKNIGPKLMKELAAKVREISEVNQAEAKNSDTAS